MALPTKPSAETLQPPGTNSGLPMRERLRIFGIGAGIGLMMVGLYFAGRKQMADIAAAEAAQAAAAGALSNNPANPGASGAAAPATGTPAVLPAQPAKN